VGWLLDARIRKVTGGTRSLDDLMRLALQRFSGERGFTGDQFKALAVEVAGVPLDAFFRQTVESTGELDYSEALDWFGLRFRKQEEGKQEEGKKGGITGATTRVESGRLIVTRVPVGTPASEAGLNVDDEIIAIDDYRVQPDRISQRLGNYSPGDRVSVLVARRERLRRIDLTLACEPKGWQLEVRPDTTDLQKNNLAGWIGL
jgi:predicted metalloprotease with PDZ domain